MAEAPASGSSVTAGCAGPAPVSLPGPVAVVATREVQEDLAARHPDGAVTVATLVAGMSALAAVGTLPARVDADHRRLVVYPEGQCCVLRLTGARDAYTLHSVRPQRFADHEQLVARALLVACPHGWVAHDHERDLPQGAGRLNAHWDRLVDAWRALGPPPGHALEPDAADPLARLLDGRRRPFEPADAPEEGQLPFPLDPAQLDAVRRAVAVPDQLVVQAPPGTGRNRTVTAIVLACTDRGERVLLTAATDAAVDRVLERLPERVLAVRTGRPEAVAPAVRPLLAGTLAGALTGEILSRTVALSARLDPFADGGAARSWQDRRADLMERISRLDDDVARATLAAAEDEAAGELGPRLQVAERALLRARQEVEAAGALGPDLPVEPGGIGTVSTGGGAVGSAGVLRRLGRARPIRPPDPQELIQIRAWLQAGLRQADEHHTLVSRELAERLARSAEVAAARAALEAGRAERVRLDGELAVATDAVRAGLARAGVEPGPGRHDPPDLSDPSDPAEDLDAAVARARARARILAGWRRAVAGSGAGAGPGPGLEQELLRYADVVATTVDALATAIPAGPGLAPEPNLDLVVVDQADQLALPTVLEPLARARRSVVVGDHRRLGPRFDQAGRSEPSGPSEPSELTERSDLWERLSGFEILHRAADDDRRVLLDVQRRMPEAVARVVSDTFYGGRLRSAPAAPTAGAGSSHAGPAAEPLVFVDTSDRLPRVRREHPAPGDGRGHPEVANRLEADLIARLVAPAVAEGRDWTVVVPYHAQGAAVVARLAAELSATGPGPAPDWADRVTTIDQLAARPDSRPHDLVVFGCTHSNEHGTIGALGDLRRLHTVLTGTRHQLVVVGDLATLARAGDEPAARVLRTLAEQLAAVGALRPSRSLDPAPPVGERR